MLLLQVDAARVWTGATLTVPDGSPIPSGWAFAAAAPVVGAGQYAILAGAGKFEVRTGAPKGVRTPPSPNFIGSSRSPLDMLDVTTQRYIDRAGPGVPAPFGVTPTVRQVGSAWLGNVTVAQGVPVPMPTPYLPRDSVVHPCVLEFYNGWNGWRYVMVLTGYASAKEENPFLVASNDLQKWVLLTDILVEEPRIATAHNSDPYLSYDPRTASIVLMWRQSIKTTPEGRIDTLYYMQTKDGVTWSERALVKGPHPVGDNKLCLSPSLLFNPADSKWYLYAFDQASVGSEQTLWAYSSPSLGGTWTVESETQVPGIAMWHGEVKLVGDRLVVLVHSISARQLYFGTSTAGSWKNFTFSTAPVVTGNDATGMYKASFLPEYNPAGTQVAFRLVWTSNEFGANPADHWRVFVGLTNFASAAI